jgi:hypothetical protein
MQEESQVKFYHFISMRTDNLSYGPNGLKGSEKVPNPYQVSALQKVPDPDRSCIWIRDLAVK